MIPKIIHYCWFGKGIMPKSQADCIRSWEKIMPDYKIMRWDESNFDVNICDYSAKAYQAKKFAYVSDVARCKALYEIGGVYLDTDVDVFQRFDKYLDTNFFSAIELYNEFYKENIVTLLDDEGNPLDKNVEIPHMEILTSIMGVSVGNKLIKDAFDYYMNLKLSDNDNFFSIDRLMPKLATLYGFRYKDETQYLSGNMVIYGTGIFGHAFCVNPHYTVSYHYNAASWEKKTKKQELMLKLDQYRLLGVYKWLKNLKKLLR